LVVEDDRIAWIGRFSEFKSQSPKREILDLGDTAILPGFINAHTHLELTGFAGQTQARSLWRWFEDLLRLIGESDFKETGPESVHNGAMAALMAGVTCVADISRTGLNAEVLSRLHIRKVCFLELISGAATVPNDIPSLRARLESLQQYQNPPQQTLGLAPHTP